MPWGINQSKLQTSMRNCVRAFKRFKDFGDGSLVNQLPTNLFVEHPLCTPGLENSFGGKQHHWNNKTKCLKKTQDLLKKNSSGKTDPLTRRKFLPVQIKVGYHGTNGTRKVMKN